MTKIDELPTDVQEYISKQRGALMAANNADHRATSVAELGSITKACVQAYESGQELLANVTADEHQQCQALFAEEHGSLGPYRANKLVRVTLRGYGQCLVPAYITALPKARRLQQAFETTTTAHT